jgi:DeoR family suf operon transcriptional repressor
MIETLGKSQRTLLKALLVNKSGLTIDALAILLNITRTAIRQHVTVLEGLGFIYKGDAISTGGRPGHFYRLTEKGNDLFPKQYALFSELLLRAILAEKGADGLGQWLDKLGTDVAGTFKERVAGKTTPHRIIETVDIMNTLAYEASVVHANDSESLAAIEAVNCVYHDLAAEHRQVCQFDLALLSHLVDAKVVHEQCIQRGDNVCRFSFKKTS